MNFISRSKNHIIWCGDECVEFSNGTFQTDKTSLINGIKNSKEFGVIVFEVKSDDLIVSPRSPEPAVIKDAVNKTKSRGRPKKKK